MPQIKLNVDRFDDLLGDEFFGFFEGNPIWLYRALGHFVMNGNDTYLSHEEGFKWVKANMTVKEVKEMRSAILKELQEKSVPLANEKPSETP